jgi:phage baseplate assembly protein W
MAQITYTAASLTGPPQWINGSDVIKQSIRLLALSRKRSVALSPEYGCGLPEYIDQPLATSKLAIIRELTDTLRTWERRIAGVRITPSQTDITLTIQVDWIDVASLTNQSTTI